MKNKRKIVIVFGTRPEIIKLAPIIHEIIRRGIPFITIHTGQHYSYEMDKLIFENLGLPTSTYNLEIGSGAHDSQTTKMVEKIETILMKEIPTIVLVQGDTNSALAGALAASKLHIPIGHIEAGLRSYDKSMQEEINRVTIDHISDYLFTPTLQAKQNAIAEGIIEHKIFVTGNTIVDSVLQNVKIASQKSRILQILNLSQNNYFLLTLHRAENVDSKERLGNILKGIKLLCSNYQFPIVWPIHPRTKARLTDFNLWESIINQEYLHIIEPVGFLDFLSLQANSKLIITDSGGVQEEACILRVPCITVRDNTERPESVEVGANCIVGTEPQKIIEGVKKMLLSKKDWNNPFGKGDSAEIIMDLCVKVVIDGRNCLPKEKFIEAGIIYKGIGR